MGVVCLGAGLKGWEEFMGVDVVSGGRGSTEGAGLNGGGVVSGGAGLK